MHPSQPLHLLLIEDQIDLAKNIAAFFEQKDHVVDFAHEGRQGLQLALSNTYDVIILDWMLPGMDGLAVCENIRGKALKHIPIIMLTARDTLADKVTGFELGADDYLTKPFALEELYMRCLALSKRHQLNENYRLQLGELQIDRQRQQAFRKNIKLELNTMGFRILTLLAEAYPQVMTRTELCQKLWGDDPTESDSLRSHIYQLRQAVDKPFDSAIIKTIHGVGFTLDIDATGDKI